MVTHTQASLQPVVSRVAVRAQAMAYEPVNYVHQTIYWVCSLFHTILHWAKRLNSSVAAGLVSHLAYSSFKTPWTSTLQMRRSRPLMLW